MAAKPIVLLDLDRMLFDSDRFIADVRQVLQDKYGIDAETVKAQYTDFCSYNGTMRHYDFFRHMQSFGLESDLVEQTIETALKAGDYAYPDVADFIDFVKSKAEYLMVLTHGEHRFQYLKFVMALSLHGIDFKDVLAHKREYIAQEFAGKQGVLIDDAQVGELPEGFKHILVSRYEAPGAFHSLTEVAEQWATLVEIA